MKIIRVSERWGWNGDITTADWLAAMTPISQGLRGDGFDGLLDELASHFPQPGRPTHREMPVILAPGKEIRPHAHPEWTMVYFIDAEGSPIVINGQAVWPANNTAILLPPEIPHWVLTNNTERPRISLALRWETENEPS